VNWPTSITKLLATEHENDSPCRLVVFELLVVELLVVEMSCEICAIFAIIELFEPEVFVPTPAPLL
jgi:hypothetical protein